MYLWNGPASWHDGVPGLLYNSTKEYSYALVNGEESYALVNFTKEPYALVNGN